MTNMLLDPGDMPCPELRADIAAFQAAEPRLLPVHRNKTALMHDCEIVGLYDTQDEAVEAGTGKYGQRNFSVHVVGAEPVWMGTPGPLAR